MMVRKHRRTDLWLAFLGLALLLVSPIENALSNNLTDLLPTPVRDHALPIFTGLLGALVLCDLALIPIRRVLEDDPIRARSRRLQRWNYLLAGGLSVIGAVAGIICPLAASQVPALSELARAVPWLLLAPPLSPVGRTQSGRKSPWSERCC